MEKNGYETQLSSLLYVFIGSSSKPWELKQTMAAVETNTSPNKRFNKRNNEYAPAFF